MKISQCVLHWFVQKADVLHPGAESQALPRAAIPWVTPEALQSINEAGLIGIQQGSVAAASIDAWRWFEETNRSILFSICNDLPPHGKQKLQ